MHTWAAVGGGLVAGFVSAVAALAVWRLLPGGAGSDVGYPRRVAALVNVFRLPSGSPRELFLVPGGPDSIGEPHLASVLWPGEEPPREFASLLLANVSAAEPWEVDLDATPLRGRIGADAPWEPFIGLAGAVTDERLAAGDRFRLRALGAGERRLSVAPKSMRQVLLALPAGRTFSGLSDVQWGTTHLLGDRLEPERIRRFREDPGAATMGR